MNSKANFKVDPKLAELLGETYKSTEDAIKELVDNAYDADADNIWITLPEGLKEDPIVSIKDDGTGMKEQEIRAEYLKIASSRFSRKGERTNKKNRIVKGRKGIGKFSGLMVAEVMEIITKAGGKETNLTIIKEELSKEKYDLEKVNLPIGVTECNNEEHGTIINLKGLNQNFNFPNSERLKQILIWDYGRVQDLSIYVNDEKIGIQDFQGITHTKELTLANGKTALLVYTICDKNVKQPGLIYRVGDKIVGRPINFLKDDEIIPDKLKNKVVGEIICDALEDSVTSDWGSIFENSKLNEQIIIEVKNELNNSLNEVYKTDMHLARLRYKQRIERELQRLPEYKRSFAEKSLQRVLEKFYGDSEERISTLISVVVDALEKDYYWNVIKNIEESRDRDIEDFALALNEFGFLEMSIIANQAINRLKFLDELDYLKDNPSTLEATIHKALEKNLWVLGNEYSLISSNKTLAKTISDYANQEYQGERANKRPDLFLGKSMKGEYLLIEFKRPNFKVDRDAENQAIKYRDDLNSKIPNENIEIMVIGGEIDKLITSRYERGGVNLLTYTVIISNARIGLKWLIEQLSK